MKKLIAFLLTLAMLAALGMNALAESELSGGNTQSAGAALRLLRYHLDSIREMEQLRPGSILSLISCR